ncbi:MAG TPA: superoxide dismutase [Alphaproteobacteria bacterium]|jgi:Fe-Mn family superoxide dismutase
MRIECPPLPFAYDALQPHMSAETLRLHHDRHQQAYFDKLCNLVDGTEFAGRDLETIIASTAQARATKQRAMFNNAAQVWNHSFFWQSLAPVPGESGRGAPPSDLMEHIERDFGGFADFREKFAEAAIGLFGSGWVWLAHRKGELEILALPNAGTPIADGASRPLLTLDVWEHAYYVDHRNRRDQFVHTFLDHLANWDFAATRLRSRTASFDPAAYGQGPAEAGHRG